MTDTAEVNTDYLETWIINDPAYYDEARRLAEAGDIDALREYATKSLRSAPKETGAWYTSRQMSDADLETVDWDDVRETLVN